MIHQLEVLEVVCVGLTDALSPICHHSKEHFGFEVRHHEHLEVIRLNVTDSLICTEETLRLDLDYKLLQAFDGSCIVCLSAILILIVANNDPL